MQTTHPHPPPTFAAPAVRGFIEALVELLAAEARLGRVKGGQHAALHGVLYADIPAGTHEVVGVMHLCVGGRGQYALLKQCWEKTSMP
jgi:hypothetical protein